MLGATSWKLWGQFFSSGYDSLLVEKGFPGPLSPILPQNVILLNKGGPIPQSLSKSKVGALRVVAQRCDPEN